MAVAENQSVAMCKEISGTLHIRVDKQDQRSDKQDKRADRQDETIDKVRNRLPGYAVAIQGLLISAVSILATFLAVTLGG